MARVDDSLTVPYGLRANEDAVRDTVKNIAAFAAMTFSPTDPDGEERDQALASRVNLGLSPAPGKQKISDIEADLATASATLGAANDFFNTDDANPPRRVSGPPATATALTSGTPADTVFWYTG